MLVREEFHADVVLFKVDDVRMIGNARTGALIGLTIEGEDFVRQLQKAGEADCPAELDDLFQALNAGNFFKSEGTKQKITSAYLHVTDRCNLHCLGCYSFVEGRNGKPELSLEEIKQELDQLYENGVKAIVISGGEPFLRDDIHQICEYAKRRCFEVNIITNGMMPGERYKKALPYIDNISVSVDGYNKDISYIRDKGIMPQVMETIELLVAEKADVNMIFTVHKKNVDHLADYRSLAEAYGTTFNFSILTTSPHDKMLEDYILGEAEFEIMEAYLKENGDVVVTDSPMESIHLCCRTRCGAGKTLVSIAADGTVYPCHMLHVDSLKLGNLMEAELKDIVFSDDNPFLNIDVKHINGCENCKYGYFCGGGCRAESYLENGDIYQKTAVCTASYKSIDMKFQRLKALLK